MKKKLLSVILAVSMIATLMMGCGDTTEETTSTGEVAEEVTEEVAEEVTEEPAAEGEVQVGIVLPTKDEPRWLQDQAQFETILGDAGFSTQVLFSQGSSATEKN